MLEFVESVSWMESETEMYMATVSGEGILKPFSSDWVVILQPVAIPNVCL